MSEFKEIYFAGGCFWGTEKVFQSLHGVVSTTVGYANGTVASPSYELVKTDTTGHRETVKVIYDSERISLNKLLKAFFICIDPTVSNRQGNDIGSQYQTGVYYTDEASGKTAEKVFDEVRRNYDPFCVELAPLSCFYDAEEYHQDYLIKNPGGYCHITGEEYDRVLELNDMPDPDLAT
ncbi:MAG: peptide-methionine (S)-S-oxide reductase MsrA [Oscillospiraceae bacterium]|nr:peptide-methionine (S)-S-oxide reductase MsrA [Oscillospiraceae bacterium]MBQ5343212.1 peptide-methionine (S)-S-oxide reductase MsrA [Oscillospiraceae bacterium]